MASVSESFASSPIDEVLNSPDMEEQWHEYTLHQGDDSSQETKDDTDVKSSHQRARSSSCLEDGAADELVPDVGQHSSSYPMTTVDELSRETITPSHLSNTRTIMHRISLDHRSKNNQSRARFVSRKSGMGKSSLRVCQPNVDPTEHLGDVIGDTSSNIRRDFIHHGGGSRHTISHVSSSPYPSAAPHGSSHDLDGDNDAPKRGKLTSRRSRPNRSQVTRGAHSSGGLGHLRHDTNMTNAYIDDNADGLFRKDNVGDHLHKGREIHQHHTNKSVTFARKVSYVDQQSRRKPHNCVSSMGSSDGTTETNLAIDRLIAPSQTPGRSHRRTSSDNTEVRNNERFYKKQPTSATTTLLGSVGNRYKHRDQRSSTKHSSEKVLRNRQNKQDDCPHCPQRSEGFPSQDNRLRDDNIKGNHSSGTMTQQVSSETRFEKIQKVLPPTLNVEKGPAVRRAKSAFPGGNRAKRPDRRHVSSTYRIKSTPNARLPSNGQYTSKVPEMLATPSSIPPDSVTYQDTMAHSQMKYWQLRKIIRDVLIRHGDIEADECSKEVDNAISQYAIHLMFKDTPAVSQHPPENVTIESTVVKDSSKNPTLSKDAECTGKDVTLLVDEDECSSKEIRGIDSQKNTKQSVSMTENIRDLDVLKTAHNENETKDEILQTMCENLHELVNRSSSLLQETQENMSTISEMMDKVFAVFQSFHGYMIKSDDNTEHASIQSAETAKPSTAESIQDQECMDRVEDKSEDKRQQSEMDVARTNNGTNEEDNNSNVMPKVDTLNLDGLAMWQDAMQTIENSMPSIDIRLDQETMWEDVKSKVAHSKPTAILSKRTGTEKSSKTEWWTCPTSPINPETTSLSDAKLSREEMLDTSNDTSSATLESAISRDFTPSKSSSSKMLGKSKQLDDNQHQRDDVSGSCGQEDKQDSANSLNEPLCSSHHCNLTSLSALHKLNEVTSVLERMVHKLSSKTVNVHTETMNYNLGSLEDHFSEDNTSNVRSDTEAAQQQGAQEEQTQTTTRKWEELMDKLNQDLQKIFGKPGYKPPTSSLSSSTSCASNKESKPSYSELKSSASSKLPKRASQRNKEQSSSSSMDQFSTISHQIDGSNRRADCKSIQDLKSRTSLSRDGNSANMANMDSAKSTQDVTSADMVDNVLANANISFNENTPFDSSNNEKQDLSSTSNGDDKATDMGSFKPSEDGNHLQIGTYELADENISHKFVEDAGQDSAVNTTADEGLGITPDLGSGIPQLNSNHSEMVNDLQEASLEIVDHVLRSNNDPITETHSSSSARSNKK